MALKHHISQLDETSQISLAFKTTLLEIISKRFGPNLEISESNRDLVLASLSVPHFKSNFISNQIDERKAKDFLHDECIKLTNEEVQSDVSNEPDALTESDPFYVLFSHNHHRRSSIESNIDSEIARYLADKRQNLDMLNEYPHIKSVYYKHNTTLSSSAPVERLFSQSKLIFRPQRNRLSPENFEKTLLLKINSILLK